jgi:ribokinase
MRPEIVGFGHILFDLRCYVDRFPKSDKTSFIKGRMKGSIGGSATNTVCNAAKLGHKGAVLGKVGFDQNGEFVVKYLRRLGIDTAGVKIDPKSPTGFSLVVVDKNGQPAVIEMLGANEVILKTELNLRAIDQCKIVHLSGAPLERLEEVAEYAKVRGKMVSFDPGRSISRMGFAALSKVLANTDLLIINRKEAAELGGPRKLVAALPGKTIVIKRGKKPTIVYDPKAFSFIEVGTAPIPKVIDTTGSGDAFAAGLLVKILEGASVQEAVSYANACGALKATREGADGLPHRKEIDLFYKQRKAKIRVSKKRTLMFV